MEKSNYALISALYSNTKHGLYSDIYFPIIKYAIVNQFAKRKEGHPYCSSTDIQEFIVEKFGINIPHIVISKSILKISAQRDGNIKLNVFENGSSFQIQSASFDRDDEDIQIREKLFTEKIDIIETKYQNFLDQEGSINDGISFIQFISDNTDDILGYFENQDATKVDEKYATLVFFLQYLSDNENDLYQIANQLFWGSVIAGFLRSDKPKVDESDDGINSEYFLDTSIVMGVLQLSTPQREIYSREVCNIIQSSGGILRVNPMTIDEIKFILLSVEQNGPNPFTDIASACERRKLEAPELAQIRLNLIAEIERNGISIFPQMNPVEKQNGIRTYQGKKVTKLLAESRNKRFGSYSNDNYREIHDIFMDNYIKERRKKKNDNNHVFFLTSNKDLIEFCKEMHPNENYMKSTEKLILELWMHNTKPVDISGCMLTETMARCLDLHSTRVHNKIVEVSRLYNKTKNDFNADVYKDFITKLYSRAKHVIQTIEALPEDISENEFGRLIREAVDADNFAYDKENARVRNENEYLNECIISKDVEIKARTEEVERLTNDRNKLTSELESKEKERKQIEEDRLKEIRAREKAEKKSSLYTSRDDLRDSIIRIDAEISPFEKSRNNCFFNWPSYLCFIPCVIIIGIILVFWGLSSFTKTFIEENGTILTIAVTTISILVALCLYFISKDSIEKRKTKALTKWDNKKENAKYHILKADLIKKKEELKSVENELHDLL